MQANATRNMVAFLGRELPKYGGQDGPVGLVIGDGQEITAELRGSHRFPGGPELCTEQIPRDPAIIRAHYTVLGVMAGGEIIINAAWNEHGWFAHMVRGSWEADLVLALA
jgi:hypothetical protein